MIRREKKKFALVVVIAALQTASFVVDAQAYTAAMFPPSSYDANTAVMDGEDLGVAGFEIENFKDTDLVYGLSILNNADTFELPVDPPPPTDQVWDDTTALRFSGAGGHSITLQFPSGASSFGLGFANDNTDDTTVIINNNYTEPIYVDSFTQYVVGNARNGYLRIDAEAGDAPITSVEIKMPTADVMLIDHVAIDSNIDLLLRLIFDLLDDHPSVNDLPISLLPGEDMTGPNVNANSGRLGAFTNRLIAAQDLVADNDFDGACEELASAVKKLTGNKPWFIGGVADELLTAIHAIQDNLGCP